MSFSYVGVNRLCQIHTVNADIKNRLHTAAVRREVIHILAKDSGRSSIYLNGKNRYRKKADSDAGNGNPGKPTLTTRFLHNKTLYTLSEIVNK